MIALYTSRETVPGSETAHVKFPGCVGIDDGGRDLCSGEKKALSAADLWYRSSRQLTDETRH